MDLPRGGKCVCLTVPMVFLRLTLRPSWVLTLAIAVMGMVLAKVGGHLSSSWLSLAVSGMVALATAVLVCVAVMAVGAKRLSLLLVIFSAVLITRVLQTS